MKVRSTSCQTLRSPGARETTMNHIRNHQRRPKPDSTTRPISEEAAWERRVALWIRGGIDLTDDEFDRYLRETEPEEDRAIITRYLAGELDDVHKARVEERARNDSGFCDYLFW